MFDEVMSIMNVAEQAALYAKQANDNELVEKATEIRVRAQRKAGEMLAQGRESGDRAKSGGDMKKESKPPTLCDIGVTKDQSSRWQSLASMSEEHFETAVATAKETAGEVTTAFMLREAAKSKGRPLSKPSKKDKERLQELAEAKARGVSMLTTYARLTLTALRAQSEFTQEEFEILGELSTALQKVSETH